MWILWVALFLLATLIFIWMIVAGAKRDDYGDLFEQAKSIDEWKKKKGLK